MSGDRLMCAWQAMYQLDERPESGPKLALVKKVTTWLYDLPLVKIGPDCLDTYFNSPKVSFDQYQTFLYHNARRSNTPMMLFGQQIEERCWEEVRPYYSSSHLDQQQLGQLWKVHSRMCIKGSYPPALSEDNALLLLDKIAHLTEHAGEIVADGELTFEGLVQVLDGQVLEGKSKDVVREAVEDIFNWLAKEVIMGGWLYKRTKKGANWTNWLRRYFLLTPEVLTYFEERSCSVKKGEVPVGSHSVVGPLEDFSSFSKKLSNRFTLVDGPSLRLEMAAESAAVKQEWLSALRMVVEAAREGPSPLTKLFDEMASYQEKKESDHVDNLEAELTGMMLSACKAAGRERKLKGRKSSVQLKGRTKREKVVLPDEPVVTEPAIRPPSPISDDTEVYDNNALQAQKDQIYMVFYKFDKDGNGKIDKGEFTSFISEMGLKMNELEAGLTFQQIDADESGCISFQEFYDYFVKFVLGETKLSESEASLRSAFLAADRDGSGTVNFREFAETAWAKQNRIAISQLVAAFDGLDHDHSGEISYQEFREFFSKEANKRSSIAELAAGTEEVDINQPVLEDVLKNYCSAADAHQMADYLQSRWKGYASFRRAGATGDLVMHGKSGIVADVVPGEYSLIDLACFNDLPPIKPRITVVKGTVWQKSAISGKSGQLFFPEDFLGELATDLATNETLAYYGCSLADRNQLKVSLLYRHGIQDFTYENTYLEDYVLSENALGGAGIEKHGFAHLDCPLEEGSGLFILAKEAEDDELHLTAFKIPTRHTLYVPPFTIHSNDYLKGTWRTMLSDEAEINHVQLVKRRREGNNEILSHFHFQFQEIPV